MIAGALVAGACVLAAVTYRIFDTDFWQHLTVGHAIWQRHAIPAQQVWIWPTHGEPYVLQSWGFRALLWPIWNLGGVAGLQIWRWVSTLAVFVALWLTLRRMGARGFIVLPVLVLAALTYRQRSMPRPETLAAILLAAEFWLLEMSRAGGRDRTPWLIAIACVWVNVHISWYLGLLVLAAYAVDATWRRRYVPAAASRSGRLWLVLGASIAASFLNPFGARALAEPYRFFFEWRHDPLFRSIAEFQRIDWGANDRNGMILIMVAWPVLQLWRARQRGWDVAETLLWLALTPAPMLSQRFIGPWAVTAGLFVARDLDAWVRARTWPAWSVPPRVRAALAVLSCLAFTALELTRKDFVPGVGLIDQTYPEAAADFIQRHHIRGRSFNQLEFGGYLLWRFWPDRERLPFVANHPEAMRADDRLGYVRALTDPAGWAELDHRYRFDWVLLKSSHASGEHLLDYLDADSAFALVFTDDVAALYLRRGGSPGSMADSLRYRLVPGGESRLAAVEALVRRNPVARGMLESELRRIAAESRLHVWATSVLVGLMEAEGRSAEAVALVDSLDPATRAWVRRARSR